MSTDAEDSQPSPLGPRSRTGITVTAASICLLALVAVAVLIARRGPVKTSPPFPARAGVDQTGIVYARGFDRRPQQVPAALKPVLGTDWRNLHPPFGSFAVSPQGVRDRFFAIGFVASAVHKPGRLLLLTNADDKELFSVAAGPSSFGLVLSGPLRVPSRGQIFLQLRPIDARTTAIGPPMVISPIQAWYLASGEAIIRMPALRAEANGVSGFPVVPGSTAYFRIAPGVHGRVDAIIDAVSAGRPSRVTVSVGGSSHNAALSGAPAPVLLRGYPRAAAEVAVTVPPPSAGGATVVVGGIRLVPTRG